MDTQKNVDITAYNTLHSTVTASEFIELRNRDQFIKTVQEVINNNKKFMMIGSGSNLIFLTDHFDGLLLRNLWMETRVEREEDGYVYVTVSSGYPIGKLVGDSMVNGWSGIEYHLGLPGTVGGAVYMNSKWTNPTNYVGDSVFSAHIITPQGELKKVDNEYFRFRYDYSVLHDTKDILVDVTFKFKKDDQQEVSKRAKEAVAYRHKTQPVGVFSSGCFFQNISEEEKTRLGITTKSAGYLIDTSGLKGHTQGGYRVSDIHANFIINDGTGTVDDLKKLLDTIKSTVKIKYGVDLQEEVRIIS